MRGTFRVGVIRERNSLRLYGRGSAVPQLPPIKTAEAPESTGYSRRTSASGKSSFRPLRGVYNLHVRRLAGPRPAVQLAKRRIGAGRAVPVTDGGLVGIERFRGGEPASIHFDLFAYTTLNDHFHILPGSVPSSAV